VVDAATAYPQRSSARTSRPASKADLWELREESRTNTYRIVYFFFTGRRIVFLHGFQKKTQKTPRQELEIAHQRYQHFRLREGRGREKQ
jgi:phage-related protein